MQIGILSDTHGRQLSLRRAIKAMEDVDLIFHLGDYTRDAEYIAKTENIPVIYVRGNCDYSSDAPTNKLYTVDGTNIFLTHGHLYNVKYGYEDLVSKARDVKADVVLFGHTHVPENFIIDNILFVNPGSAGLPKKGHRGTYAILKIEGPRVRGHLKKL